MILLLRCPTCSDQLIQISPPYAPTVGLVVSRYTIRLFSFRQDPFRGGSGRTLASGKLDQSIKFSSDKHMAGRLVATA
jgi:hypothetical protein